MGQVSADTRQSWPIVISARYASMQNVEYSLGSLSALLRKIFADMYLF